MIIGLLSLCVILCRNTVSLYCMSLMSLISFPRPRPIVGILRWVFVLINDMLIVYLLERIH